MKLSSIAVSAALLFALISGTDAAGQQDEGVQVFVPESLTDVATENENLAGEQREVGSGALSTTGKKVSLVGKVDAEKGLAIEIVNNNRAPVPATFHDSYFHADVVLSLGLNLIEIRWKRGDKPWNSKKLPIFRSTKVEGGITSNYPTYTFHEPEKESVCQECHRMALTQAEVESNMQKMCLKCHKGLTDNLHVHGPVGVGACTVCHNPESMPNKYKVEVNDDVLCYKCHTDRKEIDDKRKFLHGPVGAKMCTVCHDPHSSPFEFSLVKSKGEICMMCHGEDAGKWMNMQSLHSPFKTGNCTGCHDPHSADYTYNLKASREDICDLCHKGSIPGHLHEVGKIPQFDVPDDFPLTADGRTMCLTCHDPHGAVGEHLTRRVGCDGCHTK